MSAVAEAVVPAWPYQDETTIVVPYQKTGGIFRETFLPEIYFRLKDEDTLKLIFPGMGIQHLNDFVCYMSRVRGFVIPCRKEGEQVIPCGLGWMAEIDGVDGARKGAFGFGFFKEMWVNRVRVRQHVSLSFEMLNYWFTTFSIDNMFGTSINPKALAYSRRFGFTKPIVLPKFFNQDGTLIDAHVISLERPTFMRYHSSWRSLTAM